jgi:hypothetical protein
VTAIVDVQAMASFETMVDVLLPIGLMPAVVPEFKGITIGGSIQGLAAESTSFRFGFVHDAVIGFEALLADGTVIWCSPTQNEELFRTIPGSFGTLGIITRAKMLCVRAEPFVVLDLRLHNSQRASVEYMAALQVYSFHISSHLIPSHLIYSEEIYFYTPTTTLFLFDIYHLTWALLHYSTLQYTDTNLSRFHSTALNCTQLHSTALDCTQLHSTALNCARRTQLLRLLLSHGWTRWKASALQPTPL